MRRLLIAALLCTIAPVLARSAPPQAPQAPDRAAAAPLFKSRSDLVVLHVNVFDGRSDAVPDLPQTAFHVTEDDAPQQITFFNNVDVPVAVGLVIDNSGSMITRRHMVLAGTQAFAESSHTEDEVFTIVFNEHVRYGLPDGVAFTRSAAQVRAGVTRFSPGGKTALHDAVIAALEHLQEATHQKRVLVLLSDGEDNASQHSENDMLQRVTRSDALIYTVSTAALQTGVGNRRLMRKLAETSGGVAYFPETEQDVVEAFREVADNVRRGYSIGYVPSNSVQDGRFRRVKVNVRAPGLKNLRVSARDGYLAPRRADAR